MAAAASTHDHRLVTILVGQRKQTLDLRAERTKDRGTEGGDGGGSNALKLRADAGKRMCTMQCSLYAVANWYVSGYPIKFDREGVRMR